MTCNNNDEPVLAGMTLSTDQKGAEENEGDKVEVGKVTPALLSKCARFFITGALTQTGQHDLVPGFASGAPARDTMKS